MAIFFFCGVAGIGMSSIALYLKKSGHTVYGSDRSLDQGTNDKIKKMLEKEGIILYPQDASGLKNHIDTFVVSTAVEESIPDVQSALKKNIPILKRSELLAQILHEHYGIAIGGTSGKTTVTAMVGHILHVLGKQPVMINGGISVNTYNNEPQSNLIFGKGKICVIEADESDGSIERYQPEIAVVNNISLDHKPLEAIRPLFQDFINRAKTGAVINQDDPEFKKLTLTQKNLISFSTHSDSSADLVADHIQLTANGSRFSVNGVSATLAMLGLYNIENALAAIGACLLAGISIKESIMALKSFKGTYRRMQIISGNPDLTVYDDYAHNPAKVQASLTSLKNFPGRIYAIFQPHGYAPTRLMKEAMIDMLSHELTDQVTWIMPDIYYVGGTVAKDISSQAIIDPLAKMGKQAFYIPNRQDILSFLKERLQPTDRILVMGARDNTLTQFAESIACLSTKNSVTT